jgi:hypothetical protein
LRSFHLVGAAIIVFAVAPLSARAAPQKCVWDGRYSEARATFDRAEKALAAKQYKKADDQFGQALSVLGHPPKSPETFDDTATAEGAARSLDRERDFSGAADAKRRVFIGRLDMYADFLGCERPFP